MPVRLLIPKDVYKMEISLKDKIETENQKIKVCQVIEPRLKEYFKKYLDQKIIKTDSTLIQKIKNDPEFIKIIDEKNYNVKPLSNGHVNLSIYVHKTYYNLVCLIKLCFNGGSYEDNSYYCLYTELNVYIGEVKQQILKTLEEPYNFKLIDYKEQQKLIDRYKNKYEELQILKSGIHYSLEYYRKY